MNVLCVVLMLIGFVSLGVVIGIAKKNFLLVLVSSGLIMVLIGIYISDIYIQWEG